jgi:Flp pilus assembly protein TadD
LLNLLPDDAGALNDLAWILMQDKGETGLVEAEQLATRGLARYPDDVHLLDTHGVILLHLRRYDDAKRDLEKCRRLAETQPETRAAASLHLAQVLKVQGGDATAVRQLVEEAQKIDKERRVLSEEDRAALAKLTESP